jgi:hypothetical protein
MSRTAIVLIELFLMHILAVTVLTFFLCARALGQTDLQQIYEAERRLDKAATEKGIKTAFLEALADDAVIFRPEAVIGKRYWNGSSENPGALLIRKPIFADISSNGLLGYTTGNWEYYPKGKDDVRAEYGQYATIWEKKPDGKFRVSLDISVSHEKLSPAETNRVMPLDRKRDNNKSGWSVADASMDFLRTSMSRAALGGAYRKFAAGNVRLLRDLAPPILGKKAVVAQTKKYISVGFPQKVALLQSGDLAYAWNACEFANSNEGTEKGNCLQIWKLRDKQWWIVLGVFARLPNSTKPELKSAKTATR